MCFIVKTYEPTYDSWGLFAGIRGCNEIWQIKLQLYNDLTRGEECGLFPALVRTRVYVDRIV